MNPLVSIIVVGFDMGRELPRTVRSFLPPYQRGMGPSEIQIIVADNGSHEPVQRSWFPNDADVTVLRVDDGGASPCRAINRAAALAQGEFIGVVIDGARMATPGIVRSALEASRLHPRAFISTLGFHLGPKVQQVSVTEGYDRDVEDGLLDGIDWPADGYRLFEICALGESYREGVFVAPPETTFFIMSKSRFNALGGFEERFEELGGGFANYDFFERAVEDADAPLVVLIGEGTFHQLHYGATTQAGGIRRTVTTENLTLGDMYAREYQAIRGRPYRRSEPQPLLVGRITHPATRSLFFPTATQ